MHRPRLCACIRMLRPAAHPLANAWQVKRRHPMEVDELGPHPALGMGRKPRASSPPDAIAQPVDSLARPMTSLVMSAPVTGSYFWSNCVILRVDLDPKHKCKHPDTWAIYRVKFNDEEHPHLIGESLVL